MTTTLTFAADTLTPVSAYAGLRRAAPDSASFLLESAAFGRWARYSILGYRPRYEALLYEDGPWEIAGEAPALAGALTKPSTDPLTAAAALIDPDFPPPSAHLAERIARSHVGFFAWDLVHRIAKVPGFAPRKARLAAPSRAPRSPDRVRLRRARSNRDHRRGRRSLRRASAARSRGSVPRPHRASRSLEAPLADRRERRRLPLRGRACAASRSTSRRATRSRSSSRARSPCRKPSAIPSPSTARCGS